MISYLQDPEKIFFIAVGFMNYAPSIYRALRSVLRRFIVVIVILPDR